MAIQRIIKKKTGTSNPSTYVGTDGEIFLNDSIPDLRLSDGTTPGGVSLSISAAGIATYATLSGLSQGLTGTPNISVNQVGIASYLTVSGVSSFYNDVHFEYDRAILIGNNDELQLYHSGANSYIDNSSGNNLIIRTHGGSIQLDKEGPELMGVFNTDGSVELYYNNSIRFETTSIGATVYGTFNTGIITANSSVIGSGVTIQQSGIRASGIITANSFRPSSGYYQSGSGTNAFYVFDGTGNVSFQGTIGVNQINSGAGYKALEFSGNTTPSVQVTNGLIVSGISTLGVGSTSTPPSNSQMSFELVSNTQLRIKVRGTDGVLRSANITLS